MPPLGLILSGSTATASGMPLGALGAPKRPQIRQKHEFSCFSGPLGGPPPPPPRGIPIVASGCTLLLPSYCPLCGMPLCPNNLRSMSLASVETGAALPSTNQQTAPAKGELGSQRSGMGPKRGPQGPKITDFGPFWAPGTRILVKMVQGDPPRRTR